MNVQSELGVFMNEAPNKRKSILDAALKLISENGFHGTSMSKLAKEAGISVGIIYHYFKGKDEIIDELYRDVFRGLAETLTRLQDKSQPLKEQITQLWKAMVQFYLKNPQISSFVQQYKNSPYFRPEIDRETDSYFDVFSELEKRALNEEIVKDLPRQVFYSLCLDFAGTLAQKHAKGMMELNDPLIDKIVDVTWDAIKL
jgi:AcrR family transcriptional regulator